MVSDPHVLLFFDVVSQLRSTVGDVVELVSDDQIPGFCHFVLASASCRCLKSNQYSVLPSFLPFFFGGLRKWIWVKICQNQHAFRQTLSNIGGAPVLHQPHLANFQVPPCPAPGEASASTACRPTLRAPATSWARRPGPEAIAPPSHWKLGEKAGNCLEPQFLNDIKCQWNVNGSLDIIY